MDDLLQYFLRIMPGVSLTVVTFLLVPRGRVAVRIFLLMLGFILMRDALTPSGFWQFGITGPAIWLRFTDSALLLSVLGVLSGAAALILLRVKELRVLVRWGEPGALSTWAVGIGVGVVVAAAFMLPGLPVPIELRGGSYPLAAVPALLFFALVGNFLEELIFRGFLQSYFEQHASKVRAALLTGLMFAVAHIYLASTVTDLGWPLLLFVLVEGLACAFVYLRYGLISAALVHGMTIFLLAAGLF